MLKVIKILLALIIALAVSVATYTISYFFVEIRPHLNELKVEMKAYDITTPNALDFKRALYLVSGDYSINLVKHRTATRFTPPEDRFRGFWHLIGLHWHFWMPVVFNEEEIYALRLARVYYRGGYGVTGAAKYYFHTDFNDLTCHQIIELALLDKSTFLGALGTERQKKYIQTHDLFSMCQS